MSRAPNTSFTLDNVPRNRRSHLGGKDGALSQYAKDLELETLCQNQEDKIGSLRLDNKDLRETIDKKEEKISELHSENDNLTFENSMLKAENVDIQNALDLQADHKKEVEDELKTLRDMMEKPGSESNVDAKELELRELRRKNAEKDQRIARLERENKQIVTQLLNKSSHEYARMCLQQPLLKRHGEPLPFESTSKAHPQPEALKESLWSPNLGMAYTFAQKDSQLDHLLNELKGANQQIDMIMESSEMARAQDASRFEEEKKRMQQEIEELNQTILLLKQW